MPHTAETGICLTVEYEIMQHGVRQRPHTSVMLHVAIVLAVLVFVSWGLLSPNPLRAIQRTPFRFIRLIDDFAIHLSVYLVVAASVGSLFVNAAWHIRRWPVSGVIFHAVTTELLQAWIPNRTCDPIDLVANLMGIFVGLKLLQLLVERWAESPGALLLPVTQLTQRQSR